MINENPRSRGHEFRKAVKTILDSAMGHIKSVDYKVSARWVFYRLLQEGHYSDKNDYKNKFIPMASRARHANYNGWHPDILQDETRSTDTRNAGYSPADYEEPDLKEILLDRIEDYLVSISHFYSQDYYAEILFEARAMVGQFRHYTEDIDLSPFAGHPSIPFKYSIAKRLERYGNKYGKPVVVLYFGDLDETGIDIYNVGMRDIQKWCSLKIKFIRCGLTEEQVEKYSVPENFEHPGYQWEALPDDAAREIITENVRKYVSQAIIEDTRQREEEIANDVKEKITAAIEDIEF
ncbi:MAG: hypothetical protein FVQ82_16990 [Planctomycetes bacterium]|nr:hypothetical protein [Planctomycetota bacterium]